MPRTPRRDPKERRTNGSFFHDFSPSCSVWAFFFAIASLPLGVVSEGEDEHTEDTDGYFVEACFCLDLFSDLASHPSKLVLIVSINLMGGDGNE